MRRLATGGAQVSQPAELMAAPFPRPAPTLVAILDEFRVAAMSPPTSQQEMHRLAALPRPWEPASCPHELRNLIYIWLEDVVAWINEEHTWRVDRVVPICWSEHPHIVHELASVTSMRWEAMHDVTPTALEDWQRETLPSFLERIAQRIGATGCPPGRHQPHPGTARNLHYREAELAALRRLRRKDDSESATTDGR
jgi:hypothetical protein